MFSLTVIQADGGTETRHFHQSKITIGRGSKDFPVDLRIEGDLEISRKQAVIERLENGSFSIVCEGRNPVEVDGRELQQGERGEFGAGQTVRIGGVQLRVPTDTKSEKGSQPS